MEIVPRAVHDDVLPQPQQELPQQQRELPQQELPQQKTRSVGAGTRKRMRGGGLLDSMFGSRAAPPPAAPAAAAPIMTLAQAAQAADEVSADAGENLANAAWVGRGAVAALAATGVGLPVAGALGAALILAYTMGKVAVATKKLTAVLLDVTNIVANCYTVENYMTRGTNAARIALFCKEGAANLVRDDGTLDEETFNRRLKDAIASPADTVLPAAAAAAAPAAGDGAVAQSKTAAAAVALARQVQSSGELRNRMMVTIGKLTERLLNAAPDKILELTLKNAENEGNKTMYNLCKTETDRRAGLYVVSRVIGRASRYVGRTVYAADMQADVLRELTMLQGYFMLAKSQFDAAMTFYAARVPGWADGAAAAIEASPEFRTYLVPPPTAVVAESKGASEQAEDAGRVFEKQVETEAKEQQQSKEAEQKETPPQTGGGGGGGVTRRRRRVVVPRRRRRRCDA